MTERRKRPPAGLAGLLVLMAAGPAAGQFYADDIGLTGLRNRLGAAAPTGAGVPVAVIEARDGANGYLPDPTAFPTTTITDRSGGGPVSGHGTEVGRYFFGASQGTAPGVTQADAYKITGERTAGDWLGDTYLRSGQTAAPRVELHRVHNHSYIGTGSSGNSLVTEWLRRYDLAIRRDNIVAVVGLNNAADQIPTLQASGYNSIAVGRTDGSSSVGPTVFEEFGGGGAGRSKPDIVAPLTATSWATPVVSGAAALLIQTANGKADPGEAARAGRAETIKVALLSGATKAEFIGRPEPWRRLNNGTYVEPLDRRFGAGELNIDRSHQILSAAEQVGTDRTSDAAAGWDHESFNAVGETRRYLIDVPADAPGANLSATANWLRRVQQDGTNFTASLSQIQLRLYEADAAGELLGLIDQSVSPVDNVQHVFAGLVPGRRYAIEVTAAAFPVGQSEEQVAVAWFADFAPVPEPAGVLAVVAVVAVAARRFRRA